ncbi:TetR/AcrR family transcriptional regulator [Actinomycetospora endophytica]|uniref:TetR/AcrR family transcriptional regulator n=1 Tax=Actinomycetospora endophytica TaxID=2291215 RepID=A0ABS8P8C7_9PSEU|nr:TetR/AcrR family transcriptional regulator [Actinomycetospora endophytica]MCD2194515.1 TetR/AcrR family transcriptional regulator [Actinomycetospora endophytica]
MSAPSEPGRRERKKARTRGAIADAALRLFLARGFDDVTVAEVADAADVSVTTVFNHFPSKEALVFDEEAEREEQLLGAVRARPADVDVLTALHRFVRSQVDRKAGSGAGELDHFIALVEASPVLRAYSQRMWSGYERSLALAVGQDAGLPGEDPRAAALAHVVIGTLGLDSPTPGEAVDAAFALLRQGWPAVIDDAL